MPQRKEQLPEWTFGNDALPYRKKFYSLLPEDVPEGAMYWTLYLLQGYESAGIFELIGPFFDKHQDGFIKFMAWASKRLKRGGVMAKGFCLFLDLGYMDLDGKQIDLNQATDGEIARAIEQRFGKIVSKESVRKYRQKLSNQVKRQKAVFAKLDRMYHKVAAQFQDAWLAIPAERRPPWKEFVAQLAMERGIDLKKIRAKS